MFLLTTSNMAMSARDDRYSRRVAPRPSDCNNWRQNVNVTHTTCRSFKPQYTSPIWSSNRKRFNDECDDPQLDIRYQMKMEEMNSLPVIADLSSHLLGNSLSPKSPVDDVVKFNRPSVMLTTNQRPTTTYASILKKPIKQSKRSTDGSAKIMTSNQRPSEMRFHYLRFGFPETPSVSPVMKLTKPSLEVTRNSGTRKSARSKLDCLKELLAGQRSTIPVCTDNASNLDDSMTGDYSVNGKGRPISDADCDTIKSNGCSNSLVAFIMGIGLTADSDDESDSDDDWDTVDYVSNVAIPLVVEEFVKPLVPEVERVTANATNFSTVQPTDYQTIDCSDEAFQFRHEISDIEIVNANSRWQQCYGNDEVKKKIPSDKQVSFADITTLETVHCTLPECRKSPWEEVARDRHRFQRRIQTTGLILDHILQDDHRQKVYTNQISPNSISS